MIKDKERQKNKVKKNFLDLKYKNGRKNMKI